jgi:hypothetical protein
LNSSIPFYSLQGLRRDNPWQCYGNAIAMRRGIVATFFTSLSYPLGIRSLPTESGTQTAKEKSTMESPKEKIDKRISKAAAALGRKGGLVKSAAKSAACRENGKKGGRPVATKKRRAKNRTAKA